MSTTTWNMFRFYPSNEDRYTEAPTKTEAIARGLGLAVDELDAAMLTSDNFAEGYVIRAVLDTRPEYSAALA
ncbi:hypothetical protein [Cupriavidus malaysiensis]|uniref:Uncharacterized protein n=1 Tax=Cupriavidus malaysiensis TaxID=367825 RepID=A0ABN4TFF1_9BURK|nr:hypothetical protein [Cupriavidus malaysiensis]AOZ05907.1 hypothetical protein BKK80_08785 [Cupriavidus malaysiensis]